MLGRWIAGFANGRFYRPRILEEQPHPLEIRLGWFFHYCIGVGLSVQYLLLSRCFGFNPAAPLTALEFGILTTVLPWFMMFPALGFGILARKTSRENRIPYFSLFNHFVYGTGLAILYGLTLR